MNISAAIFREYDIRGIYPDEINEDVYETIGKALGSIFSEKSIKNIALGRDSRKTSATLSQSLIKGLLSTGCNVTYTDITVQPAIHFFSFDKSFDAAINVTASHNPKNYNGIKIDYSSAKPFFDEDLQDLHKRANSGNFVVGQGKLTNQDLNESYINFITSRFEFKKKTKVLIYCANGATSVIAPKIMEKLGIGEVPIYCEFDSNFPHGVPDPSRPEFLKKLGEQVLKYNADLGIAYDGDGDRFGAADEKGNIYNADELLMLFSKHVIKDYGPTQVLYDVKSTQALESVITKLGGIPKMMKTGRAYFLDYMLNGTASLAAELSGHFYFGDDYFGYDDGLYASCRLVKILQETGKPLSELMSEFPKMVNTPEIQVTCDDKAKFELVEKIKAYVVNNVKHTNLITIDGVRVSVSETGWFLIRASNTSAYLSMRIEGKDNAEVEGIISTVAGILEHFGLKM